MRLEGMAVSEEGPLMGTRGGTAGILKLGPAAGTGLRQGADTMEGCKVDTELLEDLEGEMDRKSQGRLGVSRDRDTSLGLIG